MKRHTYANKIMYGYIGLCIVLVISLYLGGAG